MSKSDNLKAVSNTETNAPQLTRPFDLDSLGVD